MKFLRKLVECNLDIALSFTGKASAFTVISKKAQSQDLSRKNGTLIYFLGPEGSGKTTHIRLLASWLRSKGYKVKAPIYIRSDHLLLYILKKLLILLGRKEIRIRPDGSKLIVPQRKLLEKMKYFWVLAQVPMALLLALFRVYIPLWFRYIIIAERYLLDTFIDILNMLKILNLKYTGLIKLEMRLLLYFIPKNTLLVHLYAPYEELYRRYKSRNTPAEVKYWVLLQERLDKVFLRTLGGLSIDTSNNSIAETQLIIKKAILSFLNEAK